MVFDLRTTKDVASFRGHRGIVCSLAFSGDGNTLYSGGADGTILVWDIHEQMQQARKAQPLEPKEAAQLWDELVDVDGKKAFHALVSLASAPEVAVKLLKEHLKPAQETDTSAIAKLVAALDSEEFEKRDKAYQALATIGKPARDELLKALEKKPNLEVATRLQMLLDLAKTSPSQPTAESLREILAVEILETIGTPEARTVIEELSRGLNAARLTEEARAALQRIHANHR